MASTDARPVPRKNVAYRFYFAIRKNDGSLITTWAGQDSEVSKDGGNYADCSNEATEIQTSGTGYLDLTSGEMNADQVTLKITVTNTDALPLVFTLYPEEIGDYRADAVQVGGQTASAAGTVTFPATIASTTNITAAAGCAVSSIGANVITATSIASDAFTAAKFADDCFDASHFADDCFVAANFGDNCFVAANFSSDVATEFAAAVDLSALATAAELAKVPKSDGSASWNATALAAIQGEANDAIVANNLDHLVLSAVDTNFATTVHVDSVVGQLAQTSDGGYSRATDSLEAVRDRGDAAWITATGFAVAGDLMGLANGAITDAKFTVPTLGAGARASGPVGMILQNWRAEYNQTKFNTGTGVWEYYADDSTTVLLAGVCTDSAGIETKGKAT